MLFLCRFRDSVKGGGDRRAARAPKLRQLRAPARLRGAQAHVAGLPQYIK